MDNSKTTKRLLVGKINGLFGVKGFVKVFSYSEPRDKIVSYGKWLIKTNNEFIELKVSGKKQGKTIIAQIADTNTPEQAEKFLGKEVYIKTDWLPQLNNEYYYYQLENLQVFNTDNFELGVVSYLFDTGSNTVLVTKNTDKERFIPFIKPYLIDVDLENKKIIVYWDKDF